MNHGRTLVVGDGPEAKMKYMRAMRERTDWQPKSADVLPRDMVKTYDGEIVEKSTWGIASYAVQGCRTSSRDAEYNQRDKKSDKANVPDLLEGPRRGLIASIELHIERLQT